METIVNKLAIKILNNKLTAGGMQISMPNDMYFVGMASSPEYLRFFKSTDYSENSMSIIVLAIEDVEKWSTSVFSGMDSVSKEMPFVINGIPGIAKYAYTKDGKKHIDHKHVLNEGDACTEAPSHYIGFSILFTADEDAQAFLTVVICWDITTSPCDDYIACADELLKEKNVSDMLNSIQKI